MMRGAVWHLSLSRVFGGGEEHLRVLLSGLSKRGAFKTTLACPAESPLREALAGASVEFVEWGPFRPADTRAAWRLARLVRERGPALLHSHNPLEDFCAALLRRSGYVPASVTTVHDRPAMGSDGLRRQDANAFLYRAVLRAGFDRILAVSEATRRDLVSFAGVPGHRLGVVTNGTDFSRLDRSPAQPAARAALGIPPETLVFGMSARVEDLSHRKKGVEPFLEAAIRVLSEFPRAQAWVVGLGPRAELQARSRLAGLSVAGRIVLSPFRPDLPDILPAWDVAVVPSLYEGLSRTLVEAMGAGLAVVATAVDGAVEAVAPGTGLLIPRADPGLLAAALRALLSDPERRRRMGALARAAARERFSAEAMVRDVEEVYRGVLA